MKEPASPLIAKRPRKRYHQGMVKHGYWTTAVATFLLMESISQPLFAESSKTHTLPAKEETPFSWLKDKSSPRGLHGTAIPLEEAAHSDLNQLMGVSDMDSTVAKNSPNNAIGQLSLNTPAKPAPVVSPP